MRYLIEIKESARKGAVEAFLYYEEQQTSLGDRFLDKMELLLNDIAKYPKTYSEKYKQFRQALIKPFPYLIIFEIIQTTIIVHKVVFAKKHPKKLYK
jgi:hypothetical protein